MNSINTLFYFVRGLIVARLSLTAENLALRQQLAVLHRRAPRPKLRSWDRRFWVWLSRIWHGWQSALVIVKPATVVRWHRQGFRYYWRWKSGGRAGRPLIDVEARALIRRLSRENPLWGAPRIQAELRLLGHDLAKSTVAKYMLHRTKPPSPGWRSFLKNHAASLAAVDFFTVPTVTFQVLYVFLVLRHDRRRVVHFGVTSHPTPAWVAQQLREAFRFNEAPRYLIRDRDGVYGECFTKCMQSLGIEEVVIAPRSPWQNPFVERLIGTIRRECLDHLIVLNETHLRSILGEFFEYYHTGRSHRALDANSPVPRQVEPPERGEVVGVPQVGGLHHRYRRAG
jgi:transposase InsO family protein